MIIPWVIAFILILFYLTLIGTFFYGWLKTPAYYVRPGEKKEYVTIVIAARNEESNIACLLKDLVKQDYPRHMLEILIVDDHSSDMTSNIIRHFAEKYNNIRVIRLNEDETGKKAAVLKGVTESRFPLILTTDADCSVSSLWVRTMVDCFERTGADLVAGPVMLNGRSDFFSIFQQIEMFSLIGSAAGAMKTGKPVMCNAANLGFRKKVYLEARDPAYDKITSGDDVFLLLALHKTGRSRLFFLKNDDACIITGASPDLGGFLDQRKRWASKSRHYNTRASVFTAILVFLVNLYAVICLFAGLFEPSFHIIALFIIISKSLIDFPFLYSVSGFFGKRKLLMYFPAVQFLYLFYISFTAITAFTDVFEWKGRVVRY